MTGTVELDQDGMHLLIRFPYREDLVAMVKEMPGRRWDPKGKMWRVPAAHVEQVFTAFSRHLFDFAPEIPSLLAGTLKPRQQLAPTSPRDRTEVRQPTADGGLGDVPAGAEAPQALTVSRLNERVRDGLRHLFPETFWVVGEIVDFDKGAHRQHRFFQLVEKARGEARPLAAVEVALFAATAERLLPALAAHEVPLALRDGLEVRLLVRVDLWPATGRYQVVVQDIDPSFTLGKLALTKEQILGELRQRGLADRNLRLGLPVPALRIGVLTSPDADGWNDFLRHVQEARVGLDLALFPIRVQGRGLKPSLLGGLAWFAAAADQFDLLCIMRGGGSRTDLAWFDDREIALAVAQHPLKIVVGIGHQRDQSVLDVIAHSEKTPTAVAELIVRGIEAARADGHERTRRLQVAVAAHLARERDALVRISRSLQRGTSTTLGRAHGELANTGRELVMSARLCLQRAHAKLRETAGRTHHGWRKQLDRELASVDQQATRIRLLDPARVLARGFAIVRGSDGKVLPSSRGIAIDQGVRLQWRDGSASARIEAVHRDSP